MSGDAEFTSTTINSNTTHWSGFILFDGILWPPITNTQSLHEIKDWEVREKDLWVVALPKSGSHWVLEIVQLIQAKGHAECISREHTINPIEFGYDSPSEPLKMSHLLEQYLPKQIYKGNGKVIYIIRNPKDVAVSLFHFIQQFPLSTRLKEWETFIHHYGIGETQYGSWFQHTLGYWTKHRHNKNFLFLKYEDLKKDLKNGVIQIADFLGHELSDEEINLVVENSSIEKMKKSYHVYGEQEDSKKVDGTAKKVGAQNLIRKGIIGDWKLQFTAEQSEIFDKIFQKEMEGSDLHIDFEM